MVMWTVGPSDQERWTASWTCTFILASKSGFITYKTLATFKVLNVSKHRISLLDSSNVSFQVFSDVKKADGRFISRLCPADPATRLLEAEIMNENPVRCVNLLWCLPVKFPRLRSDPRTCGGLHIKLSYSLGLSIIVGKTFLQVFPGLFVTSQLKTDFFCWLSKNQNYFTPSRILRHRRWDPMGSSSSCCSK